MKKKKKPPPRAALELENRRPPITWGEVGCLALALLAVGAIRLRLIDVPLERDEGEYAAMAQVILRGGIPYLSAYNMKLPGVFYAYALILRCLGETTAAIHWGLLIVTSTSTVLTWLLARQWFDAVTAIVAALSFGVLTVSITMLGFSTNAEHFVVPPLLVGWLILSAGEKRQPLRLFAAGTMFGVAVLMKQHGAAFAAAAGAWLTITELRRGGWWPALRTAAIFSIGVVTPYAAVAAWLAANGAFERFWFWTVTYSRQYVATFTIRAGMGSLARTGGMIVAAQWPVLLAAAVGISGLFWDPRVRRRAGPLAALTLGAVASVCPGWMFREHYFLMAAPCAALWCAAGVTGVAQRLFPRRAHAGSKSQLDAPAPPFAAVVILTVLSIGGSVCLEQDYLFRKSPEQISRHCYGYNPFVESPEIARYLREHTSADDRIAVIGSEPQLYFYSGRRPATGYLYTYPLMEPQPFALAMQREMAREVDAADPRYLIFVGTPTSWLTRPTSPLEIQSWLFRTIAERYQLVGVVEISRNQPAEYHWDAAAAGYEPKTESWVRVFVRKGPAD